MKFSFKHLGAIPEAELTLGDLTIICGNNNTGKTYVTYACYGFLDFWQELDFQGGFIIDAAILDKVIEQGSAQVPISEFTNSLNDVLETVSDEFSTLIDHVFAASSQLFEHTKIKVQSGEFNPHLKEPRFKAGSASRILLEIEKNPEDDYLTITLMANQTKADNIQARAFIEQMINSALFGFIFKPQLPKPFIASAERTGSTIFQKELDFNRNKLIDLLGDKKAKISVGSLLGKFSSDYPIPVKRNVDFIRDLPNIINRSSELTKQYPDILKRFAQIIGGEYKVSKEGEIQFIPEKKKQLKLSMIESSSAVRSLLDIGFYLKHIASPGDLLMIDEPELNLHPGNQRLVARLCATLINHGIKVWLTTHSDYIIKELNTLIMLNQADDQRLQALAKREGYHPDELISAEQLRVYIAKEKLMQLPNRKKKTRCHTLAPAPIDPQMGIALESFDETIDTMNRIQDEIIWGE